MAKTQTDAKADTRLVKAAERVGRTLGRGAKRLDTVSAAAKKLVAARRKPAKKVVKKAVKKAKPASTKMTRAEATSAALSNKHLPIVDERAIVRANSGQQWAARKPR